jgi:hypothetical protein
VRARGRRADGRRSRLLLCGRATAAGFGRFERLVSPNPEVMLQDRWVWPYRHRRIGEQLVRVDVAAVGRAAEAISEP